MDANGTRFHLLLDQDWLRRTSAGRPCLSPPSSTDPADGIEFDPDRHEVVLRSVPFEFPDTKANRIPSLADRRGSARDRYGNWYWIGDTTTAVLVRSVGSQTTTVFWQTGVASACPRDPRYEPFTPIEEAAPPPPPPLSLRGLAVTDSHQLIAGVLNPPGLLVFDLHAGGPPSQLCWPAGVEFAPFDMTPRKNGGVWVLDRDHARIWGFDRHFEVLRRTASAAPPSSTAAFTPRDGSAQDTGVVECVWDAISVGDAWPTSADAIAIESYPDEGLLLVDLPASGTASRVHYLASIDSPATVLDIPHPNIRAQDLAVAFGTQRNPGDQPMLRIFIVTAAGNQALAFTLRGDAASGLSLARLSEYYPMRLYGGKGLASAGGDAYYDTADTWIALVEQPRPKFVQSGTLRVDPLDGKTPDCVWHRLMLDACIPPDAALDVFTRAANEPASLLSVPWTQEPRPYLRRTGSELPYVPSPGSGARGTWELLFQRARGRYLELKLVFGGTGRSSPRVRALRAYYPRFSYLTQYLPAIYREEPEPASFLDRFLANMEGTLTAMEDRIAAAQLLFDVRTAPSETLEWLASWFEVALDPLWTDRKRRLFIAHAMEFFARRGTVRGLQLALALTLFDCDTDDLFGDRPGQSPAARIRIVEQFLTRTAAFGPWTPKAGRESLRQAYAAFLQSQNPPTTLSGEFPLAPPSASAAAALWSRFALDTLGFVPSVATDAVERWREFLARRYHSVAGFNEVYRLTGAAPIAKFEELTAPQTAPPDGAPLADWWDYETIVRATAANAHQFTVLLPVDRSIQADSPEHRRLLELCTRVVALEKPAHTVFHVGFYWSMFRLGDVRLGPDAVLGLGSRAPDALVPMVLDRGHLSENYLAPSYPRNITERRPVIGRDRPGCGTC